MDEPGGCRRSEVGRGGEGGKFGGGSRLTHGGMAPWKG
jgi:hypothetical protein